VAAAPPPVVAKLRTHPADIERLTKKHTPPLPFDVGWRPPSLRGIENLVVGGSQLASRIGPRITRCDITQTLDEPLTITMDVWDKSRDLLTSGLLDTKVRIALGQTAFVMTRVAKNGDLLTLEFEDTNVNALRQLTSPMKVTRGTLSRIGFVKKLLEEKGVPKLQQYIDAGAPGEVTVEKNPLALNDSQTRKPGPFQKTTVKNVQATQEQLDNMKVVLGHLFNEGATVEQLAITVMVVTAESTWHNNPGGSGSSVGLFQQTPEGGYNFDRQDRILAADAFFSRLKAAMDRAPGLAMHLYGQAVQGSGAGKASNGAANYGPWEDESKKTASAWNRAYGGSQSAVATQLYEFRRGGLDGSIEDSWTCLGRLADEVQYRRFIIDGVFYFLPDELLVGVGPRLLLSERSDGMLTSMDFDMDEGVDPQTLTFSMHSDEWSVPVGACIETEDLGPGNGVWLVNRITGNLLQPSYQDIELIRPRAALTEPPADQTVDLATESGGGRSLQSGKPVDASQGGDAGLPARPTNYPLATPGKLIGVPYAGTHGKAFNIAGGSDNWESENAVDLGTPIGTPVLAVADGTIGSQIGSLGTGGRFAGLRVHLSSLANNEFYYAHLSSLDVTAGQVVKSGDQLGLSGEANGVAHLHFAAQNGDPRQLIGQTS
jgi:Peptidase family M23